MKSKEIEVGGVYDAKVSGVIAPLKVLSVEEKPAWNDRWCTRYRCRNLKTGREIVVRSPQRFRCEHKEEGRRLIGVFADS